LLTESKNGFLGKALSGIEAFGFFACSDSLEHIPEIWLGQILLLLLMLRSALLPKQHQGDLDYDHLGTVH